MKTAFLDTNVISECYREGITPGELNEFLTSKDLTAIVGTYVLFEILKNIKNDSNKASQLLHFVYDLKPGFTQARSKLYLLDINKLRTGSSANYLFASSSRIKVLEQINKYCHNEFNNEHQISIEYTQRDLNKDREAFKPQLEKKMTRKWKQNFGEFLADYLSLFRSDLASIEWLRNLIFFITESKVTLDNRELNSLLNNLDLYPVLRTSIRNHLYLWWLTETNRQTPAENRLTDGLIMIESSCCTALISDDKDLVQKHAKNINPCIEVIPLKELIYFK